MFKKPLKKETLTFDELRIATEIIWLCAKDPHFNDSVELKNAKDRLLSNVNKKLKRKEND